jgi:hypothetical protein
MAGSVSAFAAIATNAVEIITKTTKTARNRALHRGERGVLASALLVISFIY